MFGQEKVQSYEGLSLLENEVIVYVEDSVKPELTSEVTRSGSSMPDMQGSSSTVMAWIYYVTKTAYTLVTH